MSFAPAPSIALSDAPADAGGSSPVVGGLDGDRILAPLATAERPTLLDQLRIAAALARSGGGSLRVVDPTGGRRRSLTTREPPVPTAEGDIVDWAVDRLPSSGPPVDGRVLAGRRLADAVAGVAAAEDADAVVVPGGVGEGLLGRDLPERLAGRVDCDVVTVNGRRGYEPVPSILLAVAGGPHSGAAADVARRVAVDCDAWVDVLHVVPTDAGPERRERGRDCVAAARDRIARPDSTARWVLDADDPAEAVAEQSAYYGLTVVGASTTGRLRRVVAGSTSRAIRDGARSVVLSVRDRG